MNVLITRWGHSRNMGIIYAFVEAILVFNLMFIIVAMRIVNGTLRTMIADEKKIIKGVLIEIKRQLLPATALGVAPTLVLYCSAANKEEFFKNLNSFITLKPIVVYFTCLYLLSLILMYLKEKKVKILRTSILVSTIAVCGSAFKSVFQSTPGILITLSILLLFNDKHPIEQLSLSALVFIVAIIVFMPAILVDKIDERYNAWAQQCAPRDRRDTHVSP